MSRIDKYYLEHPWAGSRTLSFVLTTPEQVVGRDRVRRLMRIMGIESLAPKPGTSRRQPRHPVYPYLLRGMTIDQPNQVWATDITYIPMQRGFMYLIVIMDWATRKVLSWRLSNTLDTRFCVEAPKEALYKHGAPAIFNCHGERMGYVEGPAVPSQGDISGRNVPVIRCAGARENE